MSNLAQRVLTAIVAIPIVAVAIYVGGLVLALLLALLAGAGTWELYRMARVRGVDPLQPIGILVAGCLPIAVWATERGWIDRPVSAAGVIFVAIIGVTVFARGAGERPLEAAAVTVFAALYAGGGLAFAFALRHHQWAAGNWAGTALVFFPIVITWATDIGAYTVGRLFGKRRLMPAVSPGKTVAGAWGGLALGVITSVVYNSAVLQPAAHLALRTTMALIFGAVLAAVVQVGDLAESLFKRQAGIKDSSNLIPGHGGVLDRLDSLYFSLPVAYLILGRLLGAAP